MESDFIYDSFNFENSIKKLSTYEIKKINHPFLNKIPKFLYKYRKSGEEGRIEFYVGERKIYTASLNKLNDEFEGVTPATKERILNLGGIEMCIYYKDFIIKTLIDKVSDIDLQKATQIFDIIIDSSFDNKKIFRKCLPLVEEGERRKFKTIVSSLTYIFDGLDTKLNDDDDFAKGIRMLLDINNVMGVYCMCDSYSNDNLWADYADNFKGYCIEYDLTDPCKSKGSTRFITQLYPVRYVARKDDDWFKSLFESTIKSINIAGKANQFDASQFYRHWFLDVICQKKNSWSYQKEWRSLGFANKSQLGPLVSKIIVGHNINYNDYSKIKFYADKNGFPLKITYIDYEKQVVGIRDITEKDLELIKSR